RAERALVLHLGPIARILVKRAVKDVGTETSLWERLATHIELPADRDRFLARRPGSPLAAGGPGTERSGSPRALRAGTGRAGTNLGATSRGATSRIGKPTQEQVERVERVLTRQLGPIAKLLVKRALPSAGSEAELWERLATHIDNPAERQEFLRRCAED